MPELDSVDTVVLALVILVEDEAVVLFKAPFNGTFVGAKDGKGPLDTMLKLMGVFTGSGGKGPPIAIPAGGGPPINPVTI